MTSARILAEVVTWGRTTSGKTARMGRRTAAHVDYTIWRLSLAHPGARLHIIQSAYNTGVAASAGTHDRDGCLDVYIEGLDWWDAQRFLRECGWAAWYRYPPKFGRHIHMISLGCTGPLGIYVPGQIADYYNHRTGLAGHAADTSWHPSSIDATVFDYYAWLAKKKELDMNPVQRTRVSLEAGLKDLSAAASQLRQVPASRRVAFTQRAKLAAAIAAVRGILKVLPAS